MNHQCFRCQGELLPGTKQCPTCGLTFDQQTPGVAAAPVTPSWERRLPPQKSAADSVPRVPRQPLPPLEAPPLFEANPPNVTPPSRRRKKRLIAAALALVVAGLLFTGAYNVWDTVFPPHSMPGYNAPTTAQAQAAFATEIPVTPAAPTTVPVQQAAAPPPPVVLAPPQQTYAPQDAEVPGGQTPDAQTAPMDQPVAHSDAFEQIEQDDSSFQAIASAIKGAMARNQDVDDSQCDQWNNELDRDIGDMEMQGGNVLPSESSEAIAVTNRDSEACTDLETQTMALRQSNAIPSQSNVMPSQ